MRTKVNVLYYPEMEASETTLKKAILFFDEIHFMDRPAFMLGNAGTIGTQSPLRSVEKSFREDAGVPLFVHGVTGGKISADLLEQVYSDINDSAFLKKFQEGLISSQAFRSIQIPLGNYGSAGNQDDVLQKVTKIETSKILSTYDTAESLLLNESIKFFDFSTLEGSEKQFLFMTAMCSAKMNFALIEAAKHGFTPLADSLPYGNLLGVKYSRAINKLDSVKNNLLISDLSFAIFDELIPNEIIKTISIKDIVKYRKKSEKAREEFLEYLALLQARQASLTNNINYNQEITKIITTEIKPAVKVYRDKLANINDIFIGELAKSATNFIAGGGLLQLFVDLTWSNILLIAPFAAANTMKAAIDGIIAQRAAKRECSISYVLSLD